MIIGIDENDKKGLEDFLEEEKIQNSVTFVDKNLTQYAYFTAIDIFVLNCQTPIEYFGRAIIEAMVLQLPILGTRFGGMSETVIDGETGLLHTEGRNGVADLSDHILSLGTSFGRRFKMGRRAYKRVKDEFLEETMIKRISVVLKKVSRSSTP
ncbi:unnamed protein product [Linum trigynum]|uniref:Glycosyl transferase family 1 domain-containing protein n=1 Tax=Linum trigynum TaxID=586398 RepID=A0AAV2CH90_9ROSI